MTPEGEVSLVTAELTRPNGVALSPDGTVLYVANSDPERAIWMAYDLASPVEEGRVLFDATSMVGEERPGLPDGIAVDTEGNLFATGPGGVLVLSPSGEHLGTLVTTRATANRQGRGRRVVAQRGVRHRRGGPFLWFHVQRVPGGGRRAGSALTRS